MELTKEIFNKVKTIWEAIKDCCVAMVIGGSSVLPYIKNPHDIDIVFLTDENHLGMEPRKIIRDNANLYNLRKELYEKYNIGIIGNTTRIYSTQYIMYSYIVHYAQPLFGEEIPQEIDILQNPEACKAACKISLERIINWQKHEGYVSKALYHIITSKFILDNQSYDLSDEQIQIINEIHDRKNEEFMLQYLEVAKEWLK